MSFLTFVVICGLVFTGGLFALAYPRLLIVHAVIVSGWLVYEFPLWAVKVAALVVLLAGFSLLGARVLVDAMEQAPLPRIAWSRAERLQRRVRRLSLDGDEAGFGKDWAAFAARRGFQLADPAETGHPDHADRPNPAADPGNPGRLIATWTCPVLARRAPAEGRYLLLMVDASPHRDRSLARLLPWRKAHRGNRSYRYGLYGEIATDPDPLAAQASSWRVPRHVYAATRRAT